MSIKPRPFLCSRRAAPDSLVLSHFSVTVLSVEHVPRAVWMLRIQEETRVYVPFLLGVSG